MGAAAATTTFPPIPASTSEVQLHLEQKDDRGFKSKTENQENTSTTPIASTSTTPTTTTTDPPAPATKTVCEPNPQLNTINDSYSQLEEKESNKVPIHSPEEDPNENAPSASALSTTTDDSP